MTTPDSLLCSSIAKQTLPLFSARAASIDALQNMVSQRHSRSNPSSRFQTSMIWSPDAAHAYK